MKANMYCLHVRNLIAMSTMYQAMTQPTMVQAYTTFLEFAIAHTCFMRGVELETDSEIVPNNTCEFATVHVI